MKVSFLSSSITNGSKLKVKYLSSIEATVEITSPLTVKVKFSNTSSWSTDPISFKVIEVTVISASVVKLPSLVNLNSANSACSSPALTETLTPSSSIVNSEAATFLTSK